MWRIDRSVLRGRKKIPQSFRFLLTHFSQRTQARRGVAFDQLTTCAELRAAARMFDGFKMFAAQANYRR